MPSGNTKEKEDELSWPWGADHKAHHTRDQGAMKYHAHDKEKKRRKGAASVGHAPGHSHDEAHANSCYLRHGDGM